MEELRNEEIMETTEVEKELENSGNGLLGKALIGLGVAAVGGTAYLLYKGKDKLEERRIRKMEKKGYTVIKPVVDTDEVEVEFEDDEEN